MRLIILGVNESCVADVEPSVTGIGFLSAVIVGGLVNNDLRTVIE
jgi:hypothetical protein